MTTCSEIINSAYRRAGVIGASVVPDNLQATIGLERLVGLYERMAQSLLGTVDEYYLASGAYTAVENQRIFKASGTSVITLPVTVVDASTGRTRAPLDGALVLVADPNTTIPVKWIYNAAYAKWQDMATLAAGDVAPLTGQYTEALKDILGVLLCDENYLEPSKMLATNAALGKLAIASRYTTTKSSAKQVFF